MYKQLIKPFFFLFAPERAHYMAMDALSLASNLPGGKAVLRSLYCSKRKDQGVKLFGIDFPNRVGLAAGFDKDARWIDQLSLLGFGFIEIGTVTPKAQPGNDKPRLFRLPKDQALINRMGFNNNGAIAAAERLKNRKSNIIIGGNIGKNKVTPNEEALNDYLLCYDALKNVVDYFVVNVSSPNTPGLRALQDKKPLTEILLALMKANEKVGKPILLKIAPDLTDEQLQDIIDIVAETKIAGIIATNTTISRERLNTPSAEIESIGAGGLSGKPLTQRSTEVIRFLHQKSNGAFPIIAAGGIHTAQDAKDKLNAGASLVQVYTGFIYEGPGIAKAIIEG
jgi:dihydroorotate dehydrogenase